MATAANRDWVVSTAALKQHSAAGLFSGNGQLEADAAMALAHGRCGFDHQAFADQHEGDAVRHLDRVVRFLAGAPIDHSPAVGGCRDLVEIAALLDLAQRAEAQRPLLRGHDVFVCGSIATVTAQTLRAPGMKTALLVWWIVGRIGARAAILTVKEVRYCHCAPYLSLTPKPWRSLTLQLPARPEH